MPIKQGAEAKAAILALLQDWIHTSACAYLPRIILQRKLDDRLDEVTMRATDFVASICKGGRLFWIDEESSDPEAGSFLRMLPDRVAEWSRLNKLKEDFNSKGFAQELLRDCILDLLLSRETDPILLGGVLQHFDRGGKTPLIKEWSHIAYAFIPHVKDAFKITW